MTFPVLPVFRTEANSDDLLSLSVAGSVLLRASSASELASYTSSNFDILKNLNIYVEFTSNVSIDDYISVLNNGIYKIFVQSSQTEDLISAGIPESRIIQIVESIEAAKEQTSIVLPNSTTPDQLKSLNLKEGTPVFVNLTSENPAASYKAFDFAGGIIPVISAEFLSVDDSKISIAEIFIKTLVTDRPDGLFTTLVTDVSNHSLGLVYSSKESIKEAIKTKAGVYQSRRHGLWRKGESSGNVQELIKLDTDCDGDCLKFVVKQTGAGFCHLDTDSCFGDLKGLTRLEKTLQDRLANAPEGSYTKRLFTDEDLLVAKIKEEAEELTDAKTQEEIAWEAADLFYFSLARCVKNGVSLSDIEKNLDLKGLKITRRKGDAKEKFIKKTPAPAPTPAPKKVEEIVDPNARIVMNVIDATDSSSDTVKKALERPIQSTENIMKLVNPIIEAVKTRGDAALLELTAKFDGVKLDSPILKAPFPKEYYELSDELKQAIDISIENVEKFHRAQLTEPLTVETQPGVSCSRFSRPIESVGLYVPGGTAILPSTSIMLGVPAKVAGCKNIIFASPPRKDGTLSPEVVYVAHKLQAQAIVLAGGAQAVASLAYGTESIPKVDKILGPGNQFVTAAKMYVQNDSNALCSIDMPAGPSEVLVIADGDADPDFVASDLLSQAEHGVDSQVILIGVDLDKVQLKKIEDSLHEQALKLPRVDIVRKCIKHSTTLLVKTYDDALKLSNEYAPEHLILQINNAASYVKDVFNAGSIFVGAYSPESLGDYSSGTNHTLPTYGYAKMYSGVNTSTFQKFVTSQDVTPEGLKNIGHAVMSIAKVEGLDGHRNAVKIRMEKLGLLEAGFV